MYDMEGQKHGSKYKKLADRPNKEKIARRLTDGKVKWGQGQGEKKIINRGDMTKEAKVWFYFLASVMIPTKHVCTVREQEAVILYSILKGDELKSHPFLVHFFDLFLSKKIDLCAEIWSN